MFGDFKKFAMRGNMVDLAVGLTVGAAFSKIVTAFVDDLIMPPLGLIFSKLDFSAYYVNLSGRSDVSYSTMRSDKLPGIFYGSFISQIVSFVIVAFVVYLLIRLINRLSDNVHATEHACPYCLSNIPISASKCKFCTSDITMPTDPEATS